MSSTSHGPSFLRWAGSKRQSLARLRSTYAEREWHYVEPFAGSAALFFSLRPSAATLADLNGHLINALAYVRDAPERLHRELESYERSAENYYAVRARFNSLGDSGFEAAVLFVYLNRNCFNGLWRTNQSGTFNVPFGGTEMGANPPLALFVECAAALRSADLRHQDFRETVECASSPGAFIYADPPYFTAAERTFIEYGQRSFGRGDLVDLINSLRAASDRGATIALTYRDEELPGLPQDWHRCRFEVTRNVGGFSGSRKKNAEVLYSNRPIPAQ